MADKKEILKVTVNTNLKIGDGSVIKRGKVFTNEVEEFPAWLTAEIESNSTALDIRKQPVKRKSDAAKGEPMTRKSLGK